LKRYFLSLYTCTVSHARHYVSEPTYLHQNRTSALSTNTMFTTSASTLLVLVCFIMAANATPWMPWRQNAGAPYPMMPFAPSPFPPSPYVPQIPFLGNSNQYNAWAGTDMFGKFAHTFGVKYLTPVHDRYNNTPGHLHVNFFHTI